MAEVSRQRRAFLDRAEELLLEEASSGFRTALVLIDFSNLRLINYRHSFAVGDIMLSAAFNALKIVAGEADNVYRVGGHTFGVFLTGISDQTMAAHMAVNLKQAVTEAIDFAGVYTPARVFVGASISHQETKGAFSLLSEAEMSLSRVRDHFGPGDPEDPEKLFHLSHHSLGDELERPFVDALANDGLQVYFQPQVSCVDGRLVGVEALVRWEFEGFGWVDPERVVELADHSGRTIEFTKFVLTTALKQVCEVQDVAPDLTVSINVSPYLLADPSFPKLLEEETIAQGIAPQRVMLEITEQDIVADLTANSTTLFELRETGYGISIDDFGTGYSSLSYLRSIPATELKIDRAFILSSMNSKRDRQLVSMIIDLAHLFNMKALAEGVEEGETQAFLMAAGCDAIQGWLVSKAMSRDDFTQWLQTWKGWKETDANDLHPMAWR